MSTTLRLFSAVAIFVSSVTATITSPAQGSTWDVNSSHQIQWDTADLVAPLELHLAPEGATDASSYISTVAPTAPNTGRWTWQPTTNIPQHSGYTIIIIDAGGHHQRSPPFQLIGWPNQPPAHVAPPAHVTTPAHVQPPVHVAPPVHTTLVHVQPPQHVAPLQPSAVIITSLHVQPVVHTSQPPPIIKTVQKPPLIQTENVAPIIVTQVREPITKIQTRPNIVTTEFQQPIVKTVLVTETPAPIIKSLTQEPLTVIETQAPVLLTQTQAPIIKTLTQAPHIVTEHVAPVLVTSHITQTIHLTSFVHPGAAPPVHHTQPPVHSPVVVHPPPAQQHTTLTTIHTPAIVPSAHNPIAPVVESGSPLFPNTTAVQIPTFTTPLALPVTNPTGSITSGLGGLQPTFVAGASTRTVSAGLMSCMVALVTFLI